MSPKAKGRLVGLAVLAALVGFIVHGIWTAPPPDLMKVATEFLRKQDGGTVFETVAAPGSPLARHWDQPSIEQATHMRIQTLGKFREVVSAEPPEEVQEGGLVLRRVRARLRFERKPQPVEAVFTFQRVGSWQLHDFHVPIKDPMSLGRADEVLRRAALEVLEKYGRLRLDAVWRSLARAVRIAGSEEVWSGELTSHLEGLGPFQRVEQTGWTPGQARGVLEARLVFEQGTRNARVEARFDGEEGRVVFERFEVLR